MKMELSNILYTCTEDNWIPRWLSGKESAYNTGDPGDLSSIPRSGRYPEEELAPHSSILGGKNPMDRGAWKAIVHGVTNESNRT